MAGDNSSFYTEPQECLLTESAGPIFPEPTPERAAENLADSKYPTSVKIAIAIGIIAFIYCLFTM